MSKLKEILDEGYKMPTSPRIGRIRETEKLYRIEDKRNDLITESAEELKELYAHSNLENHRHMYQDIWKEAIPEQLRNVLESFDTNASILAAVSFLESKGFTITE